MGDLQAARGAGVFRIVPRASICVLLPKFALPQNTDSHIPEQREGRQKERGSLLDLLFFCSSSSRPSFFLPSHSLRLSLSRESKSAGPLIVVITIPTFIAHQVPPRIFTSTAVDTSGEEGLTVVIVLPHHSRPPAAKTTRADCRTVSACLPPTGLIHSWRTCLPAKSESVTPQTTYLDASNNLDHKTTISPPLPSSSPVDLSDLLFHSPCRQANNSPHHPGRTAPPKHPPHPPHPESPAPGLPPQQSPSPRSLHTPSPRRPRRPSAPASAAVSHPRCRG